MNNYSSDYISAKLDSEFHNLKFVDEIDLKSFQYIVVPCAEEVDISGENKERVTKAFEMAQKGNLQIIFLGTKLHNSYLQDYITNKNIQATIIYPTSRIQTSTKTQIIDLSNYIKKNRLNNLIITSHAYHLPRLKRYCIKHFSPKINYRFLAVGQIDTQKKQVESEKQKIVLYSHKGDLSLFID